MDVVLNHLSPVSPLLTNINSTFNNINRPDLKSAIIFDFHCKILNYYAYKNSFPSS